MVSFPFFSNFMFLVLSLLIPILVVSKWQKYPVRALVAGLFLCQIPSFGIFGLKFIKGLPGATGLELFAAYILFQAVWLAIGILILLPLQRKAQRCRKLNESIKVNVAS